MADLSFAHVSSPSPPSPSPLSACSDWAGLPGDILLSILNRLTTVDDYVRLGAVCWPWRTLFLEEISSKKPPCSRLPFLLVAPEDSDPATKALYRLSNDRVYDLRLRLPDNNLCRGSSFGWLPTVKKRRIQIRNPFLNRVLDLPRLDLAEDDDRNYLHKAVLSADPSSSPDDFIVMAIMSSRGGLAFCRAGDAVWTVIGDWRRWRQHLFPDVIFFHRTNQFYALLSSGEVMAVDLSGADPRLTPVAPHVITNCRRSAYYLVEDLSSGDLLHVFKNIEENINSTLRVEFTVEFDVFKLDIAEGEWKKIDNIGENVMFLGKNASMLRPASLCPGFEPNSCIYYTDDVDYQGPASYIKTSYGPPLDGVYNLADRSIRPHYASARPMPKRPWQLPRAVWLEPTLMGAVI